MGLSLLGEDLLPLVLAHLLSHLDPPRLGVCRLGGHEGLRLGVLGGEDLSQSCGSRLGWLLRKAGLGVAAGIDEFHCFPSWRLLLLLLLLVD